MYRLPDIRHEVVKGKRIFLRADLDVPLSSAGQVLDQYRLYAWLPTLHYLLNKRATVVIGGHLGRPHGHDERYSLFPIAHWLTKKSRYRFLRVEKTFLAGFPGWKLSENLFLLENLRFYPGEEENDPLFSKKLSTLADMYVNEAFAASHRAHASIVGLPKHLPHFAGIRFLEETRVLCRVLDKPERPLVVLVGGAKIETKLPLVEKMHQFADYVLVGGKIAGETRKLLQLSHEQAKASKKSVLQVAELTVDGKEITPKSTQNFLEVIKLAKTIVWNGPMGKVEEVSGSTRTLAKAIAKSHAYSIVGGGDTIAFLQKIRYAHKFSFVSTGGGAMLSFLSGETLPGIEALG